MTNHNSENDIRIRLFNVVNNARGEVPVSDGEINLFAYISLCAINHGLKAVDADRDEVIDTIASCPVGDDHRATLRGLVSDVSIEVIRGMMGDFTADELKDIALRRGVASVANYSIGRPRNLDLPETLRRLVERLLRIKGGDYVADLHCGDGTFLMDTLGNCPSAKVYGSCSNATLACLAAVRMSTFDAESLIECRSSFQGEHQHHFDKVFDAPPLGVRPVWLAEDATPYLKSLLNGSDPMGRPSSADWLYCRQAFDSLREDGTAAVIVTNGATFNGGDIKTRRYFVENGMVQAAIALPERLSASTAIPLTLLVLGRNDGPIRLVDATDLATPGRRTNNLSDDAISEIEARLLQDGDSSCLVGRDELAVRDYSLYAPRYLVKAPELVNPTHLGDLVRSIERGANIRAADLDELVTPEDTGLYFLRISDIVDGSITEELPHLKSVDPSTKKQWLRNGDLILSKNGAPFKVAVAEVPDGRTILANGNLYIVRLDTERVDPYFVAAFLSSEDGKRSLEYMVVGTTIPNLPLRNLRNIQIPVLDKEVQSRVAARYRANLDQIAVLRIQLDSARVALTAAYDEEMGR